MCLNTSAKWWIKIALIYFHVVNKRGKKTPLKRCHRLVKCSRQSHYKIHYLPKMLCGRISFSSLLLHSITDSVLWGGKKRMSPHLNCVRCSSNSEAVDKFFIIPECVWETEKPQRKIGWHGKGGGKSFAEWQQAMVSSPMVSKAQFVALVKKRWGE